MNQRVGVDLVCDFSLIERRGLTFYCNVNSLKLIKELEAGLHIGIEILDKWGWYVYPLPQISISQNYVTLALYIVH